VLGFRPEDIAVVDAPKGQGHSAGTIPAVAEIVEPMGAETILHLQTGAHTIICRSGEVILRSETGRRMRFFIDPARIHLFDPASTLRVAKP
jgi:multiple sugar transport system ATP-binding protein